MFTVAAVLPFLPLIEDAMIRQLEDRNPQNQQRASTFLHKVMRDSYVPHSHRVLMKILSKAEAKEREIRAKVDNMIEVSEDQKDCKKLRKLFENNLTFRTKASRLCRHFVSVLTRSDIPFVTAVG
jgi:hypothetical protein